MYVPGQKNTTPHKKITIITKKKRNKSKENARWVLVKNKHTKSTIQQEKIRKEFQINMDKRGFKTLEMPRNHSKVVQSSVDFLQSWRENCDIQIILYKSDPNVVDSMEISQVTDYIVTYE